MKETTFRPEISSTAARGEAHSRKAMPRARRTAAAKPRTSSATALTRLAASSGNMRDAQRRNADDHDVTNDRVNTRASLKHEDKVSEGGDRREGSRRELGLSSGRKGATRGTRIPECLKGLSKSTTSVR
jgi:hypothetical protein